MAFAYTEAACIKRLQEIVSEIADLFFNFIIDKTQSENNIIPFSLSYLSENNIVDAEGNIIKKNLEIIVALLRFFC